MHWLCVLNHAPLAKHKKVLGGWIPCRHAPNHKTWNCVFHLTLLCVPKWVSDEGFVTQWTKWTGRRLWLAPSHKSDDTADCMMPRQCFSRPICNLLSHACPSGMTSIFGLMEALLARNRYIDVCMCFGCAYSQMEGHDPARSPLKLEPHYSPRSACASCCQCPSC